MPPTTPTSHYDSLGVLLQSPPPTTEPTPPTSRNDSLGASCGLLHQLAHHTTIPQRRQRAPR